MSSDYTLAYGTHATAADGRCAMEWVSYLAGEPHGDSPVCVSPVVRAMCIALNDGLDDRPRQRLRPYLARTIGTASDGLDPWRAWLAMDWITRAYTPTWLELAGLGGPAMRLRALAPVSDRETLGPAVEALRLAAALARAGRAAAFGANRRGSWFVAATVTAAARGSAWECCGAAAWAAARLGIGELAGDRARSAARSAAGDAAAIAAAGAVGAGGRSAARAATMASLAPARERLFRSSLELLDRMLVTEQIALESLLGPPARGQLDEPLELAESGAERLLSPSA